MKPEIVNEQVNKSSGGKFVLTFSIALIALLICGLYFQQRSMFIKCSEYYERKLQYERKKILKLQNVDERMIEYKAKEDELMREVADLRSKIPEEINMQEFIGEVKDWAKANKLKLVKYNILSDNEKWRTLDSAIIRLEFKGPSRILKQLKGKEIVIKRLVKWNDEVVTEGGELKIVGIIYSIPDSKPRKRTFGSQKGKIKYSPPMPFLPPFRNKIEALILDISKAEKEIKKYKLIEDKLKKYEQINRQRYALRGYIEAIESDKY